MLIFQTPKKQQADFVISREPETLVSEEVIYVKTITRELHIQQLYFIS